MNMEPYFNLLFILLLMLVACLSFLVVLGIFEIIQQVIIETARRIRMRRNRIRQYRYWETRR
jgi:hypothetical protein